MPIKQDMAALEGALEGGLKGLLNELIDGAITDLDGPIRLAAQRLALAARRNKPELVAEVRDQLAVIVLEKELRLKSGGSALLETVLGIGLNALVNGAIGGLGSLKVV